MATNHPIKVVRITQYMKYEEAPLLDIGAGHVLAKVRFAGVNPVDWKIREGFMKQVFAASFPLTLGHDFAGEVVDAGDQSSHFQTEGRMSGAGVSL